MKKISIFLQIILISCLIVGCSGDAESNVNKLEDNKYIKKLPEQIEDGEYIVCINDMELEINSITMMSEVPFHILSSEELSLSDVEVNIETDVPYEVAYVSSTYNTGMFPNYVCLEYSDFDWKNFRKLEASAEYKDIQEFDKMKKASDNEYTALSEEDFPNFYDNLYVIRFDTFEKEYEKQTVNNIDISVKGDKKTFDIGNIYMGIHAKDINAGEYKLHFNSAGRANYNILQNETGTISITNFQMEVKDDVVIKNIYLLNESDSIEVTEATVDIISDEGNFNFKWDEGKEIDLNKGSEVYLNLKVQDEKFVGKQAYSVNIYVNVEYEVDGEICETRMQVLCASKYDGQTLYAMYHDGLDMSGYFIDYLGKR